MLNYNTKFKERSPVDTVNIIEQYFSSLGCTTKIEFLEENPYSHTWSTTIMLYWNNHFLLKHNGKGTTKEYCLASGYAELYERFCNKMFYCNKHPFTNILNNKCFQEKGYYLHPQEKIISFKDAFYQTAATKYFYDNIETDSQELKQYFDIVFHNKYIGVPFINVNDESKVLYLDPRIINYVTGSSGMAAGNNFYEAYVQAMSELYEHYLSSRLFIHPQEKYYTLDLKNINNPLLQNIIQTIKNNNNELYIYDLSYNYNMPVLMSFLINKYTHAITVNLGASPIFDIALERVLTELYQGHGLNHNSLKTNGQYPSRGICDMRFKNMKWPSSQAFSPIFPEEIFLNSEIKDHYNENIFLSTAQSNKELYEYLQKINNLNNFDIYYQNTSGCKEMYAIKLFCKNTEYFIQDYSYAKQVNISKVLQSVTDSYNLVNTYIQTKDFNLLNFMNLYNNINELNEEETCYFDHLLYDNYMYIAGRNEITINLTLKLGYLLNFHKDSLIKISTNLHKYQYNKNIYEQLIPFVTTLRYYINPNYTEEEVQNILKFLNIDIDMSYFLSGLKNNKILIKNIVFADWNQLLEGYYDDYMSMLINYNSSIIN